MVTCVLPKVSAQFEKKKNGGRIPEILRYVKERKGGVSKTASERGRCLVVPFISIELDNIEWSKAQISQQFLVKISIGFLCQILH